MKITSTEKKVTIEINEEENTFPLNYLGYQKTTDGVTFLRGKQGLFTANISKITVNGQQATTENVDKLLDPLFKFGNGGGVTLPIEIADIDKLNDSLDKKADLGVDGKVLSSQLPTYVDQIIEGILTSDTELEVNGLIITPEHNKIYVDLTSNKTYRWSGSKYTEISESIALGETENTAYYGYKGKIAYDHSQIASGNPHKVSKSEVGLSNVDNTSDENKPLSKPQDEAIYKAINDIQIGGRNYILNSDNFAIGEQANDFTNKALSLSENLKPNTEYTFSIDKTDIISGNSVSSFTILIFNILLQKSDGAFTIPVSQSKQSYTFKTSDIEDGFTLLVYTGIAGSASNRTMKYTHVKLEKGNKASDWIQAPEDLQSVINYSFDEQFSGKKWIDGSKIYQKTYNIGTLPIAKQDKISLLIPNLKSITNISGIAFRDDLNIFIPLPYSSINNKETVGLCTTDNENIVITTGIDRSQYKVAYVTVQYTCTDR